jgi:hypothetical protein
MRRKSIRFCGSVIAGTSSTCSGRQRPAVGKDLLHTWMRGSSQIKSAHDDGRPWRNQPSWHVRSGSRLPMSSRCRQPVVKLSSSGRQPVVIQPPARTHCRRPTRCYPSMSPLKDRQSVVIRRQTHIDPHTPTAVQNKNIPLLHPGPHPVNRATRPRQSSGDGAFRVACGEGGHVAEDQIFGAEPPERALIIFPNDGKGVEDVARLLAIQAVKTKE